MKTIKTFLTFFIALIAINVNAQTIETINFGPDISPDSNTVNMFTDSLDLSGDSVLTIHFEGATNADVYYIGIGDYPNWYDQAWLVYFMTPCTNYIDTTITIHSPFLPDSIPNFYQINFCATSHSKTIVFANITCTITHNPDTINTKISKPKISNITSNKCTMYNFTGQVITHPLSNQPFIVKYEDGRIERRMIIE